MWAAGIGGDVAADRAGALARRIGSIVIAGAFEGGGEPNVDDAGLNDGVTIAEIDLQNPLHPRQNDHHTATDGQAAASEARASATGQEGHARGVADFYDIGDVLGVAREYDDIGAVFLD